MDGRRGAILLLADRRTSIDISRHVLSRAIEIRICPLRTQSRPLASRLFFQRSRDLSLSLTVFAPSSLPPRCYAGSQFYVSGMHGLKVAAMHPYELPRTS